MRMMSKSWLQRAVLACAVVLSILSWSATAPADGVPSPDAAQPQRPLREQLLDVQRRINDLRHLIRGSHTRLALVHEQVTDDLRAVARLTVRLEDELGAFFRLRKVLVLLDGEVQFRADGQRLIDRARQPVFDGMVSRAAHTVQVLAHIQGHGAGVFSYLKAYRFELRASHSLTPVAGKTTQLRLVVRDRGDVLLPFEERPALRFVQRSSKR